MHLRLWFFIAVFIGSLSACAAREVRAGEDQIRSYAECVAAGYAVRKTLPPSCAAADGVVYFEELPASPSPKRPVCRDLCGNGTCEQIVCRAIGCPCSETHESCPKDCP